MNRKKQRQIRSFSIVSSIFLVFSMMTPGLAGAESISAKSDSKDKLSQTDSEKTEEKVKDSLQEAYDEEEEVTFLIKFAEQADTAAAKEEADAKAADADMSESEANHARNSAVLSALKETANEEQHEVKEYLKSAEDEGLAEDTQSFYVVNMMAVTATEEVADEVADFDEVEYVTKSETRKLPEPEEAEKQDADDEVEWNVDRIDAPAAWELDYDGTGSVVASIDTGAEWDHPALKEKYYGYDSDEDEVDHEDAFFDATTDGDEEEAYDDEGHGTHTIGTMVGSEPDESNQIGVAPGAKFISAKALDSSGAGEDEYFLAAGEWVAEQSDNVDVVNNSWGSNMRGEDDWYMDMVDSWIDLGIFPAFSAGNESLFNPPDEGSITPPANYPQSFATGSTDSDDMLADYSLQGPSPYDEEQIKPDISAPGSNVRSSVPDGEYDINSGTSMASPAVAGVVALINQVKGTPDGESGIEDIKDTLTKTATERTDDEFEDSPNMGYGYGIVNAYKAIAEEDEGLGTLKGTVEGDGDQELDGDVTVEETEMSTSIDSDDGSYKLVHGAGEDLTAVADAYGYEPSEETVTIEEGEETEQDFDLEEMDKNEATGQILDEETGLPIKGAEMHLIEDSKVDIGDSDNDGQFSFEAYEGTYTLKVMHEDYHTAEVEIDLEDGDVEEEIELEPLYTYPGDQIGYDQGEAENGIAMVEAGDGIAMKLSLPEDKDSAILTKGVFQFYDDDFPDPGGTEFQVEVWDADEDGEADERIAGPIDAEAIRDTDEWTEVDLEDENIIVEDDFYMVAVQTEEGDYSPAVSSDEAEGDDYEGRSYQLVDGNFQEEDEYGNFMIRADVDYEVEAPEITAPDDESYTNDSEAEVEGNASPTTTVKVSNDDEEVGKEEVGEDGEFSFDADLDEGENTFVAETLKGKRPILESDPVTVILDTEDPELSIDSPEDGESLDRQEVTVEGTVEDDNLDTVEVNGEEADVDEESYSKQILLEEGTNEIEVVAEDKAGNSTTETIEVEVISEEPELDNVEPEDDQYLTPGDEVDISFSSETEGGEAEFQVNLPTVSSEDDSSNMEEVEPGEYEGTWEVPAGTSLDGASITVALTDKAGNTVTEEADGKIYVSEEKTDRIAGDNGIETAVETSKKGWSSADTVVLSRSDDFGDSLAGVPLAHELDAPMLLTDYNILSGETEEEIERLGAEEVVILGGEEAVGPNVEETLKNDGLDVRRIAGDDRFDTAAEIAEEVAPDGTSEVAVVNAQDYQDALAVASSAAQEGIPILLTESDEVPETTQETIDELGADTTQVIGGKEVISDSVMVELPGSNRLSGNDSFGTNIDVLHHYGVDSKHMYVATNQNFEDGLTGAVLAAKNDSSILLVDDEVPHVTQAYITDEDVNHLSIFGGPGSVSEAVEELLGNLLK